MKLFRGQAAESIRGRAYPWRAAWLLIGMCSLTACGKRNAAPAGPPPPTPVTVVELKPGDVAISNEWVGTLDGFVNAQIQPQASGYLVQQNYREGSQVAKGQVLFTIDPRPFLASVAQAKGQLGQAQGQVQQSKAQLQLAADQCEPRHASG